MRYPLKLNQCALLCQPHLNLSQTFFASRLKSDSSKSSDTTKKGKKEIAPVKSAKEGAAKDGAPKDAVSKDAAKKDGPPPKDETAITGGSKCVPKPPPPIVASSDDSRSKSKKQTFEEISNPSRATKKKVPLTKIQGGAPDCTGKKEKKPPAQHNLAGRYQKYSLFLALPLIAILTLLIFGRHMEDDRPEFKNYDYMYKRDKRFYFGDGNRSAFHNSHFNALPPDGYEDEIDEEGLGQQPETEKDKKSRLKEFEKVFKKWKKHADKRNAEMQKQMAAH